MITHAVGTTSSDNRELPRERLKRCRNNALTSNAASTPTSDADLEWLTTVTVDAPGCGCTGDWLALAMVSITLDDNHRVAGIPPTATKLKEFIGRAGGLSTRWIFALLRPSEVALYLRGRASSTGSSFGSASGRPNRCRMPRRWLVSGHGGQRGGRAGRSGIGQMSRITGYRELHKFKVVNDETAGAYD